MPFSKATCFVTPGALRIVRGIFEEPYAWLCMTAESMQGWQRFGEMLSTTQAEHAQRGLQQVGEVTVVTTAEALQQAVLVGKEHIEIQAHLDLTELDYPAEAWNGLLGSIPTTVKSIRVSHSCGSTKSST